MFLILLKKRMLKVTLFADVVEWVTSTLVVIFVPVPSAAVFAIQSVPLAGAITSDPAIRYPRIEDSLNGAII